jgi:hypothetical protein
VLPDERQETAVDFLKRAVAFYRRHGIRIERLLTDNGGRLPLRRTRARLSPARHPPPAYASLPPADQRQGGALHPHTACRLGVRRDLRLQPGTHRGP